MRIVAESSATKIVDVIAPAPKGLLTY